VKQQPERIQRRCGDAARSIIVPLSEKAVNPNY